MAHGLDQFSTGVNTALSGRHQYTATEQLLQTTGMSPNAASNIDTLLSITGTAGGTAIARSSKFATVPSFKQSTPRAAYSKLVAEPLSQRIIRRSVNEIDINSRIGKISSKYFKQAQINRQKVTCLSSEINEWLGFGT